MPTERKTPDDLDFKVKETQDPPKTPLEKLMSELKDIHTPRKKEKSVPKQIMSLMHGIQTSILKSDASPKSKKRANKAEKLPLPIDIKLEPKKEILVSPKDKSKPKIGLIEPPPLIETVEQITYRYQREIEELTKREKEIQEKREKARKEKKRKEQERREKKEQERRERKEKKIRDMERRKKRREEMRRKELEDRRKKEEEKRARKAKEFAIEEALKRQLHEAGYVKDERLIPREFRKSAMKKEKMSKLERGKSVKGYKETPKKPVNTHLVEEEKVPHFGDANQHLDSYQGKSQS